MFAWSDVAIALLVAAALLTLQAGLAALVFGLGRRPRPGRALVLHRRSGPPRLIFEGSATPLIPKWTRIQELLLGPRTLTLPCRGALALPLGNGRLDVEVEAVLDIPADEAERVVRRVGCAVANHPEALLARLRPALRGGLEGVAGRWSLSEARANLAGLEAQLERCLAGRLHGFRVRRVRFLDPAIQGPGEGAYRS